MAAPGFIFCVDTVLECHAYGRGAGANTPSKRGHYFKFKMVSSQAFFKGIYALRATRINKLSKIMAILYDIVTKYIGLISYIISIQFYCSLFYLKIR